MYLPNDNNSDDIIIVAAIAIIAIAPFNIVPNPILPTVLNTAAIIVIVIASAMVNRTNWNDFPISIFILLTKNEETASIPIIKITFNPSFIISLTENLLVIFINPLKIETIGINKAVNNITFKVCVILICGILLIIKPAAKTAVVIAINLTPVFTISLTLVFFNILTI